jgi:hypothetical protein
MPIDYQEPCPFCKFATIDCNRADEHGGMACCCRKCGAYGPRGDGEGEAKRLWNTRGEVAHPTKLPLGKILWNPVDGNSTPAIHLPLARYLVTTSSGAVWEGARYIEGQWRVPPVLNINVVQDGDGKRLELQVVPIPEGEEVIAWSLKPEPYRG